MRQKQFTEGNYEVNSNIILSLNVRGLVLLTLHLSCPLVLSYGNVAAVFSPAKVPADASFRAFQPVNKGMNFDD